MVVNGISHKEDPLFLKKDDYAACGMAGKLIDLKCLASEIKYVTFLNRLKGRHADAMLLEFLNGLRRLDEQVSQLKIPGIHICLIEINISKDVIAVTVRVDDHYRLVRKAPDIALDVAKAAHRVDNADLIITFNDIACRCVTLIHKMKPGLKFLCK